MEGATTIASYGDLVIWSAAVELAVRCYEETKSFPKSEVYELTSQIRRSATSIAEGYGRDGQAQFIQFLRVSQGSLKELETHITISARVGMLPEVPKDALLRQCDELGKMLRSFIRTAETRR